MNISKELKNKAIELNLCEEWQDAWGNPTKAELVDFYIKGLDFCIANNYPDNTYIKTHFGEIAEAKGVYVDKKNIDLYNPKFIVLNGECDATIKIDGFTVSNIYIRHNSCLNVIVEEYAIAFIHIYDEADLIASSNSGKKTFVYQNGGSVTSSGNILIRKK